MKKVNILTVSMIAILAATNARADIASTSYVDGKIQPVETKIDNHVADTDVHVTAAQKTAWSAKQDAISDLETIRSGAAAGATALQSVPDADDTTKGIVKLATGDADANLANDKTSAASLYTVWDIAETAAGTVVRQQENNFQSKSDSKVNTPGTYIVTGNNVATNLSNLDTAVKNNADAIATKAAQSDLTSHTGNTTVHITAAERTKWDTASTTASAAKTTADAALPAATYNTQVGTVSAQNMGTTASTIVGAINELKTSITTAGTNASSTYATQTALSDGLALKQNASDSNVTGTTNYLTAGNGVAGNLKALDTQVKSNADAIATKAAQSDLTSHTENTTVHITAAERTKWDTASTTASAAKTTADAALPAATYNTQVGTVSATNMGTTASTIVGAINELKTAITTAGTDASDTYATKTALSDGLALKQNASDSNVTGTTNYLTAGNGVAGNLKALDTQVKSNADAIAGKQATISDLETIRSNATAGKGAANTIATYGDVVTHNASDFATSAQGTKADSALQAADITTGSSTMANGTISVKGTAVAVKGLGSAAYTASTAYAPAGNYITVPTATNTSGKSVLTYDADTTTYYWETIGR